MPLGEGEACLLYLSLPCNSNFVLGKLSQNKPLPLDLDALLVNQDGNANSWSRSHRYKFI